MMNISTMDAGLAFEGILDETCKLDEFLGPLSTVMDKKKIDVLTLDVAKITRANSSGIITFLQFLQNIPVNFRYLGTPIWMVNQFNMISQFLPAKAHVHSIQVPFYCENTDESKVFTLEVNKDIPVQSTYIGFDIPDQVFADQSYEVDMSPQNYLLFLSQITDRYQS